MVLGGQHISAALYQRFKTLHASGGAIGEYIQYVRGTIVIKTSASKRICRMAAAFHQSIQQNVQGVSLMDLVSYLAKVSKEKFLTTGSPFLDEGELYYALTTCGITKPLGPGGEQMIEEAVTGSKALAEDSESVCFVVVLI